MIMAMQSQESKLGLLLEDAQTGEEWRCQDGYAVRDKVYYVVGENV